MTDSSARTALLLLDLMPIVVPAFGGDDSMIARLNQAADAARTGGVDVVHVRVRFRPGYPDVAGSNKIFSLVTANFDFTESNPETAIHSGLDVFDSDIQVTKRRVSAFTGSDLDLILRSRGVGTLVLAGVTTSGVVLSTLRQAADLDYRIVVLSDGCDDEADVHEMMIERVFPAHALILTTGEWVDSLKSDPRTTDM